MEHFKMLAIIILYC